MPKSITDLTYVGSKAYINYIKVLKKKYRESKTMKLWIARDKNNALGLYTVEPTLYDNKYYDGTYSSQMIDLDENLFPEVTFENSPQQVEIKLIKE